MYDDKKFCVIFDILTPRPHFIVKFSSENRKYPRFKKVEIQDLCLEEIDDLLDCLFNFINNYELNSETICISFHTGKWASTPDFHAHICVNLETYLKIFKEKNLNLETIKPTSNWCLKNFTQVLNNIQELYIENVKFYKQSCVVNGAKYKNKEIQSMKNMKQNSATIPSITDNIRLDFDMREPKLKFNFTKMDINNSRKTICGNLLKEMCNFSKKIGILEKPNGCHICINIDLNNNYNGYVHLSGDKYFTLHPLPSLFLENFGKLENYSVET